MTSILNKVWRASQPANVSSSSPGFTPINGKSDRPAVSRDGQESNDKPEIPKLSSVYQGNYIRSMTSQAPLESQIIPIKSAASRPSKKTTHSTMSNPLKSPKAMKVSSSSEARNAKIAARNAKKALKNFEVLKASAMPVAPVAPMARRTVRPKSPIISTVQEAPVAPIPLSTQRIHAALLPLDSTANSEIRIPPDISGIRSTPASSAKPNLQHTNQASDKQEQVSQQINFEDFAVDCYTSPPLFVTDDDSIGGFSRTQTTNEQKNDLIQHEHDLIEQGNDSVKQGQQKEILETQMNNAQGGDDDEEAHALDDDGDDENEGSEEEYEVEKILNHEYRNDKLHFYLKWKGYDDSENTWEPEENLAGTATDFLQAYFDGIGGRPSKPRKRLTRKRTLPREQSEEYQVPSPRLETPEPWSPSPPEKGNWDEYVFRINHMCRVGEKILVGVIWIIEDQEGNRYQTQQEYQAVRLAAPIALFKYYEDNIRFEDTAEIGIPMNARFSPVEKASLPTTNNKNESRSRKRGLEESISFTILPTRQIKSKA